MKQPRQPVAVRTLLVAAGSVLAAGMLYAVLFRISSLGPQNTAPAVAVVPAPPASDRIQAFRAFVEGLWPQASLKGVRRATFDAALGGVEPDLPLIEQLHKQPEYERTAGEYLAGLVSEQRIAEGQRKLAEMGPVLLEVQAAYGVDSATLVAFWGIESNYGREPGTYAVPRSLATLAFLNGRRAEMWRAELLAALVILERGDIALAEMTGSWAGAMGQTQFMPTSYLQYAIDFDKDGRRDIWRSAPDALASAANFLKAKGWRPGEPWGFEVVLPADFNYELAQPTVTKPLDAWQQLGIKPAADRAWPASERPWSLLLPAGYRGPAFLVSGNFTAILRYNNSSSYALAIGQLSERLAGAPPATTRWPGPEQHLNRAQRLELQHLLLAKGFAAGTADGTIGGLSRSAVRDYQKARGLPADGFPSLTVLERLRAEAR